MQNKDVPRATDEIYCNQADLHWHYLVRCTVSAEKRITVYQPLPWGCHCWIHSSKQPSYRGGGIEQHVNRQSGYFSDVFIAFYSGTILMNARRMSSTKRRWAFLHPTMTQRHADTCVRAHTHTHTPLLLVRWTTGNDTAYWWLMSSIWFNLIVYSSARPQFYHSEILKECQSGRCTSQAYTSSWALESHDAWYCWWLKSCTTWYAAYPTIYNLYIPGGAGFLPSTVWQYVCSASLAEGSDLRLERIALGSSQVRAGDGPRLGQKRLWGCG